MQDKKLVGRPRFTKNSTQPKTYCFFTEDVEKALNNGWTPKEVFRLGILSKEQNPQLFDRIRELEEKNAILAQKIGKAAQRLYELEGKVEL